MMWQWVRVTYMKYCIMLNRSAASISAEWQSPLVLDSKIFFLREASLSLLRIIAVAHNNGLHQRVQLGAINPHKRCNRSVMERAREVKRVWSYASVLLLRSNDEMSNLFLKYIINLNIECYYIYQKNREAVVTCPAHRQWARVRVPPVSIDFCKCFKLYSLCGSEYK